MKRYGLVVSVLVIFAGPVHAQQPTAPSSPVEPTYRITIQAIQPRRPAALIPLYLTYGALQAADGYLTLTAIHHGAVEQNPIVAPIAGKTSLLFGLKAATTASTLVLIERFRREHPYRAICLIGALDSGMGWVVWHNHQVIQENRR